MTTWSPKLSPDKKLFAALLALLLLCGGKSSFAAADFASPALGMTVGQEFNGFIPVGTKKIPLPAGTWKVVSRTPINSSSGLFFLDDVVLANVIDNKLDGIIDIKRSTGIRGGVCQHKHAIDKVVDNAELCSAMNGYEADDPTEPAGDDVKTYIQHVKTQGVQVYADFGGAYFGYQKPGDSFSMFILYSPDHMGLPDHRYGEAIPSGWLQIDAEAYLVPWSNAIFAGLSGTLNDKDIPALPDLRGEGRPEDTKLEGELQYTVTVNGTTVPLPQGKWEVLARHTDTNDVGDGRYDHLILGQIVKNVLMGIVKIDTNRFGVPGLPVQTPISCQDSGGTQHFVIKNEPGNAFDCWVFALTPPLSQVTTSPDPTDIAAKMNLQARHVTTPFMVMDAFIIASKMRLLNVVYSFPPNAIDPQSPLTFEIPAHNGVQNALAENQRQAAQALIDWGSDWHKLLEKGYAGRLSIYGSFAPPALGDAPPAAAEKEKPQATGSAIAVGDTVKGTLNFSGFTWPLPPGEWHVATTTPEMLPTGEVSVDEVGLVQFTDKKVSAMAAFLATDPHMRKHTKPLKACEGKEFVSYQYNKDGEPSDCWLISRHAPIEGEDKTKTAPIVGPLTAWLKSQGSDFPHRYFQVRFDSLHDGRVTHSVYQFIPEFHFADKGADIANYDPSLTDLITLRQWAIKWHSLVMKDLNGAAKEPLPAVPHTDVATPFYPPALGLQPNQTFEHYVPVGPMRIPLPPGTWQVAAKGGINAPSGEQALDSVGLFHIVNNKLDGVMIIEQVRGARGGACKSQPSTITDNDEDDSCAQPAAFEVDNPAASGHDYLKPELRHLKDKGIETYNLLFGGHFGYTNHFSSIIVNLMYTPPHFGIPDHHYGEPIPPTLQQIDLSSWLTAWHKAMKAGLTGNFDNPNFEIRPDAKITLRPDDTKLDSPLEGSLTIDSKVVPLPPGKWEILANHPEVDETGTPRTDHLVLGQIAGDRLTGFIKIQTNRIGTRMTLKNLPPVCDVGPGKSNHFVTESNFPTAVDCWMSAIVPPIGNTHPEGNADALAFTAARLNLESRHIKIPYMVFDEFLINKNGKNMEIFYAFEPDMIDPSTTPVYDMLPAQGAERAQFINNHVKARLAMMNWGSHMHDLLKQGFDGQLQSKGPVAMPAMVK